MLGNGYCYYNNKKLTNEVEYLKANYLYIV